jgi:methyltransferase (TIGR00027 family)
MNSREMPHKNNNETPKEGITRTGFMANYWKYTASKSDFWHQHAFHGETNREKPLFKDEYMPLFINKDIENEAKQLLPPQLALAISVRHKYLNNTLSQGIKATDDPTVQVVLLGSGYDTRAVRKQKYPVKFFEIDKSPVLAYKKNIYIKNSTDPNAAYIGIDYLKEDFIEKLKEVGLDIGLPTHFIWEGNTLYLSKEEIDTVLLKIRHAFSGKVFISFDYRALPNQDISIPEINDMLDNLKAAKAPMSNGYPKISEEIAQKLGFTLIDNISCSELTKKYNVGDQPYVSQKDYFLCTLAKSIPTENQSTPKNRF